MNAGFLSIAPLLYVHTRDQDPQLDINSDLVGPRDLCRRFEMIKCKLLGFFVNEKLDNQVTINKCKLPIDIWGLTGTKLYVLLNTAVNGDPRAKLDGEYYGVAGFRPTVNTMRLLSSSRYHVSPLIMRWGPTSHILPRPTILFASQIPKQSEWENQLAKDRAEQVKEDQARRNEIVKELEQKAEKKAQGSLQESNP